MSIPKRDCEALEKIRTELDALKKKQPGAYDVLWYWRVYIVSALIPGFMCIYEGWNESELDLLGAGIGLLLIAYAGYRIFLRTNEIVKNWPHANERIIKLEKTLLEEYKLLYCRCSFASHLYSIESGKIWNSGSSSFYGQHKTAEPKEYA